MPQGVEPTDNTFVLLGHIEKTHVCQSAKELWADTYKDVHVSALPVSSEDTNLEPCPSVAGNSLNAGEQTASLPLVVEDFKVAPYSARAS